jgi:hypothetical protein
MFDDGSRFATFYTSSRVSKRSVELDLQIPTRVSPTCCGGVEVTLRFFPIHACKRGIFRLGHCATNKAEFCGGIDKAILTGQKVLCTKDIA